MNTSRQLSSFVAMVLLCITACRPGSNTADGGGTGSGTGGGTGGGGGGNPVVDGGGTVVDGGGTVVDGGGTVVDAGMSSPECDKPVNVAKKAELTGKQPSIGVRSKTQIARVTTFASLGGDATEMCEVSLNFKDSNGNGTVDPYEDWTLTAAARAADLVGKMSADQKLALMAHPLTTDAQTGTNPAISAGLAAALDGGVRFAQVATAANVAALTPRATWANNVQAAAEASALGIPVVLSSEPSHSAGNGRTRSRYFTQFPQEMGIGATGDLAMAESYGKIVATEYRAVGISMALSVSANLATDPRWFNGQFTFGETSADVANMVGAYVKGLQGAALSKTSVAAVVSHFPGAGAAEGGFDARLNKGKFVTYPGNKADEHLAAFQKAFDNGAASVMTSYAISKTGAWTALAGTLNGTTLEQVGASFNKTLVTDVLRTHYNYGGLVVAPRGVLDAPGTNPLGAPWGVESLSKAERIAKAVNAGVDQFVGLDDLAVLAASKTVATAPVTDAMINASATRALSLIFSLGLFENPYVDPVQAPLICNTDDSFHKGLDAMNASMVLVVNGTKPAGFLNGTGDGTQMNDKGNAGNGTMKILPAPPGEPYVSVGCRYYMAGNVDLDYVRSVSAGYGEMTNDVAIINGTPVVTEADKMSLSDYVFIRVSAPATTDTDSGPLFYPMASLEYGSAENTAANLLALKPIADAQAAIAARPGSTTQIVVGIDSGRPAVVSEIMSRGANALYVTWAVSDKVFLDVAFGIVNGTGRLPVGLPLSDVAVATQNPDQAGDGQSVYVKGSGSSTASF